MKLKLLLIPALCMLSSAIFAQSSAPATKQFLLIVRYKADFKNLTPDQIKNNMAHWGTYMGELFKNGKIAGGSRITLEGETLTDGGKTSKPGPYVANGEMVSSVLIIKTADMAEAKTIAGKCPAFELGGSVEIRAISDMAN